MSAHQRFLKEFQNFILLTLSATVGYRKGQHALDSANNDCPSVLR